jgi:hypothetical protein
MSLVPRARKLPEWWAGIARGPDAARDEGLGGGSEAGHELWTVTAADDSVPIVGRGGRETERLQGDVPGFDDDVVRIERGGRDALVPWFPGFSAILTRLT